MSPGDQVRVVNETSRHHMWEGVIHSVDHGSAEVILLDGRFYPTWLFDLDELELVTPAPTMTPPRSKDRAPVSQE